MSKDFEREYKQYKMEETPDLWDRIEAGIEPRVDLINREVPTDSETIKIEKIHSGSFVGIVAACLILVLMIPTIIRNVLGNSMAPAQDMIYENSTETDSAKTDMSQTESMAVPSVENSTEMAGAPAPESSPEMAGAGGRNGDERQKSESLQESSKAAGETKSHEVTVKVIQLSSGQTKTEPWLLEVEIEKSTETDLPEGTVIEVIAEQTLVSSLQENYSYQILIIEKWNSLTENVEYYLDKVLENEG